MYQYDDGSLACLVKQLCLQALQDCFGGWNSEDIVPIFANYTATLFEALGESVKYWTTINEPKTFCWEGYGSGIHAPGIKEPV